VNSSESPGRKKPTNRPVSANRTTKMPVTPNAVSNDRASTRLISARSIRTDDVIAG
jgi:hypothetical protein